MCVLPLADVQTIAVIPEYEGRGIGTHLLRTMVARAIDQSATDLLLEVRADNPRAQGLYERHGFEVIHRRPRYYRDGVDGDHHAQGLDPFRVAPAGCPAPVHFD